jgi:hypothetical protein
MRMCGAVVIQLLFIKAISSGQTKLGISFSWTNAAHSSLVVPNCFVGTGSDTPEMNGRHMCAQSESERAASYMAPFHFSLF